MLFIFISKAATTKGNNNNTFDTNDDNLKGCDDGDGNNGVDVVMDGNGDGYGAGGKWRQAS